MRACFFRVPDHGGTWYRRGSRAIPHAEDIRIAIHAAGLNPVDYKIARMGHPNWRFPHILGLDVAGVVDAVERHRPSMAAGRPGLLSRCPRSRLRSTRSHWAAPICPGTAARDDLATYPRQPARHRAARASLSKPWAHLCRHGSRDRRLARSDASDDGDRLTSVGHSHSGAITIVLASLFGAFSVGHGAFRRCRRSGSQDPEALSCPLGQHPPPVTDEPL